jgi:cell shape-determining protein MreC
MTFQIKHTRRNRSVNFWKLVSVAVLVVVLVVALSFDVISAPVTNFFSPFFTLGSGFYDRAQVFPGFFSDKNDIIRENQILEQKLNEDRLLSLDYESLKAENRRLRDELGLKPQGVYITAAVLAKPPQTLPGSFILDRGAADGINVGDEVFVSEKVMIGRISEVFPNRSFMTLNSFGGIVSYGVLGRTGEPLEVKGAGSGSMESFVPIDFDIESGDMVFKNDSLTSLVAVVGAVETDNLSGTKNIFLSIPSDISKVTLVFIRATLGE